MRRNRIDTTRARKRRRALAEAGDKTLRTLLASALALSMVPTGALEALAEEGEGVSLEEPLEMPEEGVVAPETAAPEAGLDEGEPEVVATEVAPEPTEPEPAEPEPAPAEPAPAEEPVFEGVVAPESIVIPRTLSGGLAVSAEAAPIAADGEVGIDGVYNKCTISIVVMGVGITPTPYPTVTLVRRDLEDAAIESTETFVLDDDTWFVDTSGVGHAAVTATNPGDYVEARISGVNTASDPNASGTSAIADLTVAATPKVGKITLKDADDATIKGTDNNDLNLAIASGTTIEDARSVTVRLTADVLDCTDSADTSSSKVVLVDGVGNEVAAAPFVPEYADDGVTRVPHSYVAVVDHAGSDPSADLPQGKLGVKVVAVDRLGNRLQQSSDVPYQLFHGSVVDDATLGKVATADGSFMVDNRSPQVSVLFPGYTPATPGAPATGFVAPTPAGVDFFYEKKSALITISDVSLGGGTTIIDTLLASIPTSGVELIGDGRAFARLSDTTDEATGIRTVTVRVNFDDGIHPADLVVARDEMEGHAATTYSLKDDHDAQDRFIVDTTAPEVYKATIDATPVADVTDTANRVHFFKTKADETDTEHAPLRLYIDEPYGIRSIQLKDPTDAYELADVSGEVTASNDVLEPYHQGDYALVVIDTLRNGQDVSDKLTVTITDFAGNQYVWSLAEEGVQRLAADGLDASASNAELLYTDLGGISMGHPTLLVEDDIRPVVSLLGPATDVDFGRFYDGSRSVDLSVVECNLRYLRGFSGGTEGDVNGFVTGDLPGLDPNRSVMDITYTPYPYVTAADAATVPSTVTVSDLTPDAADLGNLYTYSHLFTADGDYAMTAKVVDAAGNESNTATIETFHIDTVKPVVTVTYDNDAASAKSTATHAYYQAARTATISVEEHNFDPTLFTLTATAADDAGAFTPSGWAKTAGPNGESVFTYDGSAGWTNEPGTDTWTYQLPFDTDGTYTLSVRGADKAGNQADPHDSITFTIDTEVPVIARYVTSEDSHGPSDLVVELPQPTRIYNGTSYYAAGVTLDAQVRDRTFDAADTTVDGTVVEWTGPAESDAAGYRTYALKQKLTYDADGAYQTPQIVSRDLAGNVADNSGNVKDFVVDLEAPTLTVTASHEPSTQGFDGSGDPYNFYNQSTALTFTISDKHALYSVVAHDPDGTYSWDRSPLGEKQVTGTVTLQDNAVVANAEFGREIVLTAIDMAGNTRTWSIDHNGTVKQLQGPSAANVTINNSGQHPIMLVEDMTNPVVSLSGVTAGEFYNTPQSVLATVEEFNLDHLQQFDAGRVIVTVTKRDGNAGGAQSSWTIPASSFSGAKPTYSFTQAFDSDGHYEVTAQFDDYAGNHSNVAQIGEFTIDTTAPQLTMEFDNKDVRNGKYYKAARTATITVVEHNFDPSLFTIETQGSIGSWSSNGDTHTVTVTFGEGGPYTIRVNGQDRAGNAAAEVSEPEFIVDLTEPEISIAGTAQRLGYVGEGADGELVDAYHDTLEDTSAYNGVVLPTITYKDNEVLSADDLSHEISGAKHGDDVELEGSMSEVDKEMTLSFGDIGYVGPEAGDGSNWESFYVDDYAADADDIYTIKATMTDQAGNEAEAELTFSVNRYGSNYEVKLQDVGDEELDEYARSGMLSEAPTIVVREVNVSGVDDLDEQGNVIDDNHHVEKEFANATKAIGLKDGTGAGYDLKIVDPERAQNGWSEYVYTVRSANFGEGSDSDNNDRGQGVYRVNVMSDDTSSNANTTADYWRSDADRAEVEAAGATAEFILDELPPAIDEVNLPEHLSRGESYEASFHVTDDITSGNTVEVLVDGQKLDPGELQGPSGGVGTFTFTVPSKAFNWHRSIQIVVRDYAGREASARNGNWIWQSTFIPEGMTVAGACAVVVAGLVLYRKRREGAEPELPEL